MNSGVMCELKSQLPRLASAHCRRVGGGRTGAVSVSEELGRKHLDMDLRG